jgi:chitin synthase
MKLSSQKYIIISILFTINTILSTTFIIYENKWYVYLFILALASIINSINTILIFLNKIFTKIDDTLLFRDKPVNLIYLIPCYNESREELVNTLDSLVNQISINKKDKRLLIIVCDGKVLGSGNNKQTNNLLTEDILNNNNKTIILDAYKSWDNKFNNLEVYNGTYKDLNYVLLIKEKNIGKRDGLTLIRRLIYNYNKNINSSKYLNANLMNHINELLTNNFNDEIIDYIIGTDADTIFEKSCSEELIKTIYFNDKTVGVVGFVDLSTDNKLYSPFTLYQYAEYYYAQCLRRLQQSLITHKVNCLSGCVQLLKVCEETCGDYILNKFNYLPSEDANILDHIRSYASEDRNHVCLMLSEYPKVETRQNLNALAYTKVPQKWSVFLSQRRRWNLGAICNDILLIYRPGIIFYERISALINVITYMTTPFIFISTIFFIRSIILNSSLLMLYLSILILIPVFLSLTLPIIIKPMIFRKGIYYYISYIFYLSIGTIINLIIYLYAILNMDVIKWGKTRSINNNNNNINENNLTIDITI